MTLKPHHPRNRKDHLARTRKHHENEVIAFRQTMVTGGRPMSRALGITPQLLLYSHRVDLGRGGRPGLVLLCYKKGGPQKGQPERYRSKNRAVDCAKVTMG